MDFFLAEVILLVDSTPSLSHIKLGLCLVGAFLVHRCFLAVAQQFYLLPALFPCKADLFFTHSRYIYPDHRFGIWLRVDPCSFKGIVSGRCKRDL